MLSISSSPHIREDISVKKVMYSVVFALMPAFLGAIYFFGIRAFYLTAISVISALLTEYLFEIITHRKVTIDDGSAIITGILLAFNITPNAPFWMPAVGSFFAILIAKQLFGGLGFNIFNPALAGRAFLMASWPGIMTGRWLVPLKPSGSTMSGITSMFGKNNLHLDVITGATPLNVLKLHHSEVWVASALNSGETLKHLFFGNVGGCMGETSALLLLIGGLFLIFKKYADYRISLSYIGTVFVFSWILYLFGITKAGPLFHILSGGVMLGGLFMATDMVTSPVTPLGRWIFGAGGGLLAVIIRVWGGYPEGVSYSILLMNILTPLLDRTTLPRKFGEVKK